MLCTDVFQSSASSSFSVASDETIILNLTHDPPPVEEVEEATAEGSQPKRFKGINYEAKEVGCKHCKD